MPEFFGTVEGGCTLSCGIDDVGGVVECVGTFCEEFVVEVGDCFSVFAEFEHGVLDFGAVVIGKCD